jgi:hypothetical protein
MTRTLELKRKGRKKGKNFHEIDSVILAMVPGFAPFKPQINPTFVAEG